MFNKQSKVEEQQIYMLIFNKNQVKSSFRKYLLCSANQECVIAQSLSMTHADWAQYLKVIYQSIVINTHILGKQYFLTFVKQLTIAFICVCMFFFSFTHKFEPIGFIINFWEVIINPMLYHHFQGFNMSCLPVSHCFVLFSLTKYPSVLTSLFTKQVNSKQLERLNTKNTV